MERLIRGLKRVKSPQWLEPAAPSRVDKSPQERAEEDAQRKAAEEAEARRIPLEQESHDPRRHVARAVLGIFIAGAMIVTAVVFGAQWASNNRFPGQPPDRRMQSVCVRGVYCGRPRRGRHAIAPHRLEKFAQLLRNRLPDHAPSDHAGVQHRAEQRVICRAGITSRRLMLFFVGFLSLLICATLIVVITLVHTPP